MIEPQHMDGLMGDRVRNGANSSKKEALTAEDGLVDDGTVVADPSNAEVGRPLQIPVRVKEWYKKQVYRMGVGAERRRRGGRLSLGNRLLVR